jgi:uncharacterized protein
MSVASSFNAAKGLAPEVVAAFMKTATSGSNVALQEMIGQYGTALLHARDGEGNTALINSVRAGHCSVLFLAKSGSDLDAVDAGGETALMAAARNGFKAIAAMLLDRGADMECADEQGRTAMHHAVSHRNNQDRRHPMSYKKRELIALLLERGARTDVKDGRGCTPEDQARRSGYNTEAAMIAAEEKRRHESEAAQISLFTDGLPEAIKVTRIRFRHPNRRWNG